MTNSSPLAPFLRAAAGHLRAQPWAVAASPDPLQPALLRSIENNGGHPSDPCTWARRSRSRVWGSNHFFLCLQHLSLHLQPWIVPGLPISAGVAGGPKKKKQCNNSQNGGERGNPGERRSPTPPQQAGRGAQQSPPPPRRRPSFPKFVST